LDAAGIVDPALRASYETCRRINAAYGRTYYLATRLLPAAKRPFVHALYGLARHADELVDGTHPNPEALVRLENDVLTGCGTGAILPAVQNTIRHWSLPQEHFAAFFSSMRMDLVTSEYKTYDDLLDYMRGSAAVIGLQMLPILGTARGVDEHKAAERAANLGIAFQLANFIRDVGEDLDRGRLYLPLEDLELFHLTREDLERRIVDARIRQWLAFQIARAREVFRAAEPGIAMLDPTSRDCIRTAFVLYGGILEAVERADYRVLDRRVAVGLGRRITVAAPALFNAWRSRAVQR
jgi:phytoene synthase